MEVEGRLAARVSYGQKAGCLGGTKFSVLSSQPIFVGPGNRVFP